MEVNELMIGDWVYIKEHPMKAEAKKMTANHFVRSLCEFEPIQLTAEILAKNGFVQDEYDYFGSLKIQSMDITHCCHIPPRTLMYLLRF